MDDKIIKIPSFFRKVLRKNTALHDATQTSLRNFHPWVSRRAMPFFREFTDHSDTHISEVLQTASSLMTDDSRELLTPGDVAVLTLATLLHDAAMHITEDGFRHLVDPKVQHHRIEEFDAKTWQQLWAEFLSEASRFDDRKLEAIFGNKERINPQKIDIYNLGERDRYLVGEFVRRHHTRLAHEMARWGVPGPGPKRLSFAEILPEDIADLAGFVARSHGMPLRACFKYLRDMYHLREYKKVHAVFLMSVLRIADYIQVQSERAEKQLLEVMELLSPVSQREWKVHEAILDLQTVHDDPEALFIRARPADVQTYVRLDALLKDIQSEIDQSWAALGEIYGRFAPLNKLGLTLRRIRSNLDIPTEFAREVPYVPAAMSFGSAGPQLLNLLVGPLYNNDPTIGIRELIQNATDASRELADWVKHQASGDSPPELRNLGADVLVELEELADGSRWITVSDAGIGMTLEVVRNYFLKAGASFRNSDAWRRIHVSDQGRSRIMRGGRFGIGALAAFLLGDSFHITTRHVSEPSNRALTFEAALSLEALDIRYTTAPVGTTIRIRVSNQDTWNKLLPYLNWEDNFLGYSQFEHSFDWYCLSTPSVIMRVYHQGKVTSLKQRHMLPNAHDNLTFPMRRAVHSGYKDIHWSYEHDIPLFVCNGIEVRDDTKGRPMPAQLGNIAHSIINFFRPRLSIFDTEGNFPLNLQRTSVIEDELSRPLSEGGTSLDETLLDAVVEDFIFYTLANLRGHLPWERGFGTTLRRLNRYPGLDFWHGDIGIFTMPFLLTKQGLLPFEGSVIAAQRIRRIWGLAGSSIIPKTVFENLSSDTAVALFEIGEVEESRPPKKRIIPPEELWFNFLAKRNWGEDLVRLRPLRMIPHTLIVSSSDWKSLKRRSGTHLHATDNINRRRTRWTQLRLNVEQHINEDESRTLINALPREKGRNWGAAEWVLAPSEQDSKPSPLGQIWPRLIPTLVIPYEEATRREVLRETYQRYSSLIEYHLKWFVDGHQKARKSGHGRFGGLILRGKKVRRHR